MSKPNDVNPAPVKTWEDEFFESHGVKDDDEKNAIRSRARVLEYARKKEMADLEASDKKDQTKKGKKWFEKEEE